MYVEHNVCNIDIQIYTEYLNEKHLNIFDF